MWFGTLQETQTNFIDPSYQHMTRLLGIYSKELVFL
jgi:hypothetical protein